MISILKFLRKCIFRKKEQNHVHYTKYKNDFHTVSFYCEIIIILNKKSMQRDNLFLLPLLQFYRVIIRNSIVLWPTWTSFSVIPNKKCDGGQVISRCGHQLPAHISVYIDCGSNDSYNILICGIKALLSNSPQMRGNTV